MGYGSLPYARHALRNRAPIARATQRVLLEDVHERAEQVYGVHYMAYSDPSDSKYSSPP